MFYNFFAVKCGYFASSAFFPSIPSFNEDMTTDEKTLLLRIQSLNLTTGVDPQTKVVIDRNGIGPTREYIQAYFSATPPKKKACAQILAEVFHSSLRAFAEDRCFAIAYVAYELMIESIHVRDAGWHLVLGPFFLEALPALAAAPVPRCSTSRFLAYICTLLMSVCSSSTFKDKSKRIAM